MQFASDAKLAHFDCLCSNLVEEKRNLVDQVGNREGPTSLIQPGNLHLQLGRCNPRTSENVSRIGIRDAPPKPIQDMIAKCGCALSRVVAHRPIVRTRVPVKCGVFLAWGFFSVGKRGGRPAVSGVGGSPQLIYRFLMAQRPCSASRCRCILPNVGATDGEAETYYS